MKKWMVEVEIFVTDHIVVHAVNEEDAAYVAARAMEARLKYERSDTAEPGDGNRVIKSQPLRPASEEERADTYVCHHCGQSWPKRMWGPGWVTCPGCEEVAPAACELQSSG